MTDRNSITQALMDTGQTMEYPPLDAKALIDAGAMRVVQHPNEAARDPNLYSLVTPYNDMHANNPTASWPNKPAAYAAAQADLANPQSGALYDGKYRQIMHGLRSENIGP